MPFVLSLAASLLGWGRTVFAWLAKLPWYVLALAACVGVILWQHGAETRKDARIASLSATLDQVKVAQAQAQVAAQVAHDAQEAAYKAKAKDADNAYQTQLAAAQSATDRYIAGHRVRAETAPSGASTAVASTSGANTGLPATLPASGLVAVSDADVQSCKDWTEIGVKAVNWAGTINSPAP